MTLKQTKQVLKDTTWALTVKEEELKNIKVDMRDNYEGRLSELILRLNDRELKLASMTQERDGFSEQKRDLQLRVDELYQQVNCYEQELDAKTKQFETSEELVKSLRQENNKLTVESTKSNEINESLVDRLRELERKVAESSERETVVIETQTDGAAMEQTDAEAMSLEQMTLIIQV